MSASSAWLSLGPASRLAGVDPDTLRRWAETGRIEHLRTPGGHRRFRRESLEHLVRTAVPERPSLARLGATPQRLAAIYRRRYRRPEPGRWRAIDLDPAERSAFRDDGRRLVAALLGHLEPSDEAGASSAALDEAAAIVRDLGARLASRGDSLTDAVALFIDARTPFLVELGALAARRRLPPGRLAELYERASSAFDRLLLELIDSHRSGPEPAPGGEA